MHACSEGYLDVVKVLIDKGAHVNDKNIVSFIILLMVWYVLLIINHYGIFQYGTTSLIMACRDNFDIVKVLIDHGANINDKNDVSFVFL